MRILFVCHANVTRSQIAAAFFNTMAREGYHATSAGIDVTDEQGVSRDGERLEDIPVSKYIFAGMEEKGINMRNTICRALTPAMVADADTVIVLIPHETLPDYLTNSPKTNYWDIADIETISLEAFRKVQDTIEPLVDAFVKTLI